MLEDFDFHLEAREEADGSLAWYVENRPALARGFQRSLQKAIEQALRFPASGSLYLHGTRRVVLSRYPFLLVYRVRSEVLQIIAVAHTSRRPSYWRDRLD